MTAMEYIIETHVGEAWRFMWDKVFWFQVAVEALKIES